MMNMTTACTKIKATASSQNLLFMGLDFGTQSLKVTVVNECAEKIHHCRVEYDRDLPQFQTVNGVHVDSTNPEIVTVPSTLFVHALGKAFSKLQEHQFPFQDVVAISGSGQQHGSVYWKNSRPLCGFQPLLGLGEQFDLEPRLALSNGPIWMDRSTTQQCQDLETLFGGHDELARISGSRAYERFTGNQIAKIAQERPDVYADCGRISLISSFVASILLGKYAPIDYSDASGMNLLHIFERKWIDKALDGCAENLSQRLGPPCPSHTKIGSIQSYFQSRYGFDKKCSIIAFSGDNPNSVAGLGIESSGDIGISLGTSDTVFGITNEPHPGPFGHVFISPIDPDSFMTMLCYQNGSLTREFIRDQYANGDWKTFNSLLGQTSPGNMNQVGFYFTRPEITPNLATPGIWRFDANGKLLKNCNEIPFDPPTEIRAVVESQLMSMKIYSQRIGVQTPKRIIATGGGANNVHLLEVLANVFNVPVYTAKDPDSAAYGAALRAFHGWKCDRENTFIKFSRTFPSGTLSRNLKKTAEPNPEIHRMYSELMPRFTDLLAQVQTLSNTSS